MNDRDQRLLYAIATGSPLAAEIGTLVDLALADGWDVCVVTSPRGRAFLDADAVAKRTGHPVRSEYKQPGEPDVLPPADAMIAAPLAGNSIAKWAAGGSDTLPLGLLAEGVGKRLPIVAVPFSTPEQLSFPAIVSAIANLSSWSVTMLAADPDYRKFPWQRAWQALSWHAWCR